MHSIAAFVGGGDAGKTGRLMNLTKTALNNPAGLAVAVAVIAIFGLYSLSKLPIQLFPETQEPQINIETRWRAASRTRWR